MPTPEEIEKLAKQYAEFTDLSVVDQLRVKLISKEFLTWVLRDYCIVSKRKVLDEYGFWHQRLTKNCNLASKVNSEPDTARMWGKIEVLNDLFGKSLFEKEK